MNGDSLGAEMLAIFGHLYQIGIVAAACISQGGKLVDIDAEFCHLSHIIAKSATKVIV
jgi:hypothetical protein